MRITACTTIWAIGLLLLNRSPMVSVAAYAVVKPVEDADVEAAGSVNVVTVAVPFLIIVKIRSLLGVRLEDTYNDDTVNVLPPDM